MKFKNASYLSVIGIFLTVLSCQNEIINEDDQLINETRSEASECHFEYEGDEGPDFWPDLCNGDWAACGGAEQSPINIDRHSVERDDSLEDIDINYNATPTNIYNNGHTVQFNYAPGSTATLNGITYNLLQFHFHTDSEHTVNDRHRRMEVHFVHQDPNTGSLAVIGVFFKRGRKNSVLRNFMQDLPEHEGDAYTSDFIFNARDFFYNEEDDDDRSLVYDNLEEEEDDKRFFDDFEFEIGETRDNVNVLSKYYTYEGSLTTPPCSEIVSWYVLKRPINASRRQLRTFRHIMHENFRPTQGLNGRIVRRN